MAFNYGNNQIPRPELTMDYERVGHLSLGGPSHSGSTGSGAHGYSPEYDKDMYATIPLTNKSPDDLSDDEDPNQPIIKKLFTGEKVKTGYITNRSGIHAPLGPHTDRFSEPHLTTRF